MITCDEVQEKNRGKRETLISDSVYHIINNICIHLRTKRPNIYIYIRRIIYKKPLKNIIIEKTNTLLFIFSDATEQQLYKISSCHSTPHTFYHVSRSISSNFPCQATQMPSQGLSWQYASQAFVRNQALLLKALQCFSAMHLTWAALPSA
jgi:hypothetical protein